MFTGLDRVLNCVSNWSATLSLWVNTPMSPNSWLCAVMALRFWTIVFLSGLYPVHWALLLLVYSILSRSKDGYDITARQSSNHSYYNAKSFQHNGKSFSFLSKLTYRGQLLVVPAKAKISITVAHVVHYNSFCIICATDFSFTIPQIDPSVEVKIKRRELEVVSCILFS